MRAIPIVVAERMSPGTEDFRTAIVAANGYPVLTADVTADGPMEMLNVRWTKVVEFGEHMYHHGRRS